MENKTRYAVRESRVHERLLDVTLDHARYQACVHLSKQLSDGKPYIVRMHEEIVPCEPTAGDFITSTESYEEFRKTFKQITIWWDIWPVEVIPFRMMEMPKFEDMSFRVLSLTAVEEIKSRIARKWNEVKSKVVRRQRR